MRGWSQFTRFSPILCRLLARQRYGAPLTTGELARKAGLPEWEINSLSHATSWDGIPFEKVRTFATACGIDPMNGRQVRRATTYLAKKPTFKYLKQSPLWKTLYLPLLLRWHAALAPAAKPCKPPTMPTR